MSSNSLLANVYNEIFCHSFYVEIVKDQKYIVKKKKSLVPFFGNV